MGEKLKFMKNCAGWIELQRMFEIGWILAGKTDVIIHLSSQFRLLEMPVKST